MKRSAMGLGLFVVLAAAVSHGQERRVYEGVVNLQRKTIGTLILLDNSGGVLQGWIRLEKFVPIAGGSVLAHGVEFRAAGNQYEIDERRGKISYSGRDGEGSRFVQRLERRAGKFQELGEESSFGDWKIALFEIAGRKHDFRVGRPALWKQAEAPFETFQRIEELLGKEITIWVGEANNRTGRVVAVEEPPGMNIPLKAPKAPKAPKSPTTPKQDPPKKEPERPTR